MASTGAAICCSIIILITMTLLATILMGVSIANVEFGTAGLKLNTLTKKIEQGIVYLPGK